MEPLSSHLDIAGRRVGPGEPLFVMVETGVTHSGRLEAARGLVDAAKAGGADAIKFQVIGAEAIMSDRSVEYRYQTLGGARSENMFEMFKRLEFTREQWRELRDYSVKRDLLFFATTDYESGVDILEELDVPAYKVSSWDVTHLPLLRRIARTGRPVIIDTGPTTLEDLVKAADAITGEGNRQVAFLHATHSAEAADFNLRAMPYMRQVFGAPIGFSAPGRDNPLDFAAVGVGIDLIEKRLTLQRAAEGHHHILALEPDEFRGWTATLRSLTAALGRPAVVPSAEDLRQRVLYWRSVVAARDLPAGTVLTDAMLACKRPGSGIPPEFLPRLVGRATRRALRADELLRWDDV